jgi:hypothetical protein
MICTMLIYVTFLLYIMSTHYETYSASSHEKGVKLLETHAQNKGTAFTDVERASFGRKGLLPPSVCFT